VPPRDAGALARALVELLVSPDDQRRMGNHGKVTAATFSWERVSSRLLQFYDEVRRESAGRGWRPSVDLELSRAHDGDLDLIHAEAASAGGPV